MHNRIILISVNSIMKNKWIFINSKEFDGYFSCSYSLQNCSFVYFRLNVFFKVLVFWFWMNSQDSWQISSFIYTFIIFFFFDVNKYFTLFHILNQCICMLFHLLLVYFLCFIDNLNTHSIRSLFNPIFAHKTVRKSTKYCIDNYYHCAVSMTNWTTVNYIACAKYSSFCLR